MLIGLSNVSKLPQNSQWPILADIFVTIATVKVKIIPDIYTWAIVIIKLSEENAEKQFFFSLLEGQNRFLMHVPL